MQHILHDIYCSAQHDQCSLIIRTFWLHGLVGADLRPDTYMQNVRQVPGFRLPQLHHQLEPY
jgi:hypothetical protein